MELKNPDVFIVEGGKNVHNSVVYGLRNSIRRAKFPMSVHPDTLNTDLTDGIAKLARSGRGEGHDQWLTGVVVQFDLTLTVKAWVEAERYHFFDFVSSQSTMHRICKFDIEPQYIKYVDSRMVAIMKEKISEYNNLAAACESGDISLDVLNPKELLAEKYLEILYSNPCGFMLSAGMTTNYRQLKTIYHQRRTHRLPEWRDFCAWIETLPYSYLITGKDPS